MAFGGAGIKLLYNVSPDGGYSWTTKWLTYEEVCTHREDGYIVRKYDGK